MRHSPPTTRHHLNFLLPHEILLPATSSHITSRVCELFRHLLSPGQITCGFSLYESVIDSNHIEWFVVGFSLKNVLQRDPSRSVGSGALHISGLFDIVAPTSRLLWEHIALKRSTSILWACGLSPRVYSRTVGCGLLHIQSAGAASGPCASVSHSAHL